MDGSRRGQGPTAGRLPADRGVLAATPAHAARRPADAGRTSPSAPSQGLGHVCCDGTGITHDVQPGEAQDDITLQDGGIIAPTICDERDAAMGKPAVELHQNAVLAIAHVMAGQAPRQLSNTMWEPMATFDVARIADLDHTLGAAGRQRQGLAQHVPMTMPTKGVELSQHRGGIDPPALNGSSQGTDDVVCAGLAGQVQQGRRRSRPGRPRGGVHAVPIGAEDRDAVGPGHPNLPRDEKRDGWAIRVRSSRGSQPAQG